MFGRAAAALVAKLHSRKEACMLNIKASELQQIFVDRQAPDA